MGVDPADDNPGVGGHAEVAFPLEDWAGTHRPDGHNGDKAWSHKLVSGHTGPSGRVHYAWSYRMGRQLP
jgi:hypothetical protein